MERISRFRALVFLLLFVFVLMIENNLQNLLLFLLKLMELTLYTLFL